MKNLKKTREELNISQYRLAKLTGISRHKISCCECGYDELSPSELTKVKTVLKERSKKK